MKKPKKSYPRDRPGYTLIFRPYYVHPVTGKVIYPPSRRVFPMWVKTDNTQLSLDGLN